MIMLMKLVMARMTMIEDDQDRTQAKLGSMDTGAIENDKNNDS